VLYLKFTLLASIGPFQVFGDLPGDDVVFVASGDGSHGPERAGCVGVLGRGSRSRCCGAPGALGDTELDAALVWWLCKVHETTTWTTSVCTGSIYLAGGGDP
jgi:hypothetical protein